MWSGGASWPCAGAQATLPLLSPCWTTLANWCVLPDLATTLARPALQSAQLRQRYRTCWVQCSSLLLA